MDRPDRPDGTQLRAMGIDHPDIPDDRDLEATVDLLLDLGYELEDMVGVELGYLAGPRLIRPDATIPPSSVLDLENDLEFARAMVLALGFNFDQDEMFLTPAEVAAVQLFDGQREIFGEEETLAIIQVLGTSAARIARSIISSLRIRVERPILAETGSIYEVTKAYRELTDTQMPQFIDAIGAIVRRHLAALAMPGAVWAIDRSESATIELTTVGFVDMVGFTAFTEQAGQAALVDTVRTFERRVNAIVIGNDGTLVKLIGDEAMFVAADVDAALKIAAELCCLPLDERGPTSVRVGLAAGEVAALGGDYFGSVVNRAARIVGVAGADSILVDAQVHERADSRWRFAHAGAHELRGLGDPVDLWQLDSASAVEVAGVVLGGCP